MELLESTWKYSFNLAKGCWRTIAYKDRRLLANFDDTQNKVVPRNASPTSSEWQKVIRVVIIVSLLFLFTRTRRLITRPHYYVAPCLLRFITITVRHTVDDRRDDRCKKLWRRRLGRHQYSEPVLWYMHIRNSALLNAKPHISSEKLQREFDLWLDK